MLDLARRRAEVKIGDDVAGTVEHALSLAASPPTTKALTSETVEMATDFGFAPLLTCAPREWRAHYAADGAVGASKLATTTEE
jgi:hypothetical protein